MASYNIHACVGRDGRTDPERILRVLHDLHADVVALQEVHSLAVGQTELLQYFTDHTGLAPVAGPTLLRQGAPYGNALLARPPVLRIRHGDLSLPAREPRAFIDVDLHLHGPLRVINTHLGLRHHERERQMRKLWRYLRYLSGVTVLLGDFNEWRPWSRGLRRLDQHFGRRPAPRTFPARWPLLALDRAWVHPHDLPVRLHCVDSHLARRASDHLPLVLELDWP